MVFNVVYHMLASFPACSGIGEFILSAKSSEKILIQHLHFRCKYVVQWAVALTYVVVWRYFKFSCYDVSSLDICVCIPFNNNGYRMVCDAIFGASLWVDVWGLISIIGEKGCKSWICDAV